MTTEKIPWTGGNKPTHNLCVKRKEEGGRFIQVGAGWQNEKGQIHIRLDPAVVLSWKDAGELYITMFPNVDGGRKRQVDFVPTGEPPPEDPDDLA